MAELHSNFTAEGQKETIVGVYPTNHQEHETIELTEGLNDWSEVGFYIFTSDLGVNGAGGSPGRTACTSNSSSASFRIRSVHWR
jgi:hypothetical protein